MIDRNFVIAGRALFTVSNGRGEHYTFRVNHTKGSDQYAPCWFVSLLTGPDNENDYSYIGKLDPETGAVGLTRASKIGEDAVSFKVLVWALKQLWTRKDLPAGYEINHEGRCGKCGRLLTVPESVQSGYGPECIRKMAVA